IVCLLLGRSIQIPLKMKHFNIQYGWPKTTWRRTVTDELKQTDLTGEVQHIAQDRPRCKQIIDAFSPLRDRTNRWQENQNTSRRRQKEEQLRQREKRGFDSAGEREGVGSRDQLKQRMSNELLLSSVLHIQFPPHRPARPVGPGYFFYTSFKTVSIATVAHCCVRSLADEPSSYVFLGPLRLCHAGRASEANTVDSNLHSRVFPSTY
ncbi:unnamed protein product, partial [Pleuronectes platessa]